MSVAIDSSVLLHLIDPSCSPAKDPNTNQPVENATERVNYLVNTLMKNRQTLVIPTPVLSEILVYETDKIDQHIELFRRYAYIKIADFDQRAAVELAIMHREALDRGDKGKGLRGARQKVKIDRQILAIAKVAGAEKIYSTDDDMKTFGEASGIEVIHLADLPLDPDKAQAQLPLPPPTD